MLGPAGSTLFPYTTLFRSTSTSTCATSSAPTACASRTTSRPSWPRSPAPTRRWRTACSRRSEEHTAELQSQFHLVCRHLVEKKNTRHRHRRTALEQPCEER